MTNVRINTEFGVARKDKRQAYTEVLEYLRQNGESNNE